MNEQRNTLLTIFNTAVDSISCDLEKSYKKLGDIKKHVYISDSGYIQALVTINAKETDESYYENALLGCITFESSPVAKIEADISLTDGAILYELFRKSIENYPSKSFYDELNKAINFIKKEMLTAFNKLKQEIDGNLNNFILNKEKNENKFFFDKVKEFYLDKNLNDAYNLYRHILHEGLRMTVEDWKRYAECAKAMNDDDAYNLAVHQIKEFQRNS